MTSPILVAAAGLLGTDWACCEFVASVLGVPRGTVQWQMANVWRLDRPWSSVQVYTGDRTDGWWMATDDRAPALKPGEWHVVQGWRVLTGDGHVPDPSPWPNGHTFFWYAVTEDLGVALESDEDLGVRLDGDPVRPGDDLEALLADAAASPERWLDRIAPYAAGVAVAVLKPSAAAAPTQDVPSATAATPSATKEPDMNEPIIKVHPGALAALAITAALALADGEIDAQERAQLEEKAADALLNGRSLEEVVVEAGEAIGKLFQTRNPDRLRERIARRDATTAILRERLAELEAEEPVPEKLAKVVAEEYARRPRRRPGGLVFLARHVARRLPEFDGALVLRAVQEHAAKARRG